MSEFNINNNKVLAQLHDLMETSFHQHTFNLPHEVIIERTKAYELFKQSIMLEEVIEEAIAFNRSLKWEAFNKNISLATTAETLIEVFKLRSEMYTKINYLIEFPDLIEGLNCDIFDINAAAIMYQNNGVVTGTAKLIFDSNNKLPTDEKHSFDEFRDKKIAELARLIVQDNKGLNLEFKALARALYTLYDLNDIDLIVAGIKQEHYELYSKFGGFEIVEAMDTFGKLDIPFYVTCWDPSKISPFFKKIFLR